MRIDSGPLVGLCLLPFRPLGLIRRLLATVWTWIQSKSPCSVLFQGLELGPIQVHGRKLTWLWSVTLFLDNLSIFYAYKTRTLFRLTALKAQGVT